MKKTALISLLFASATLATQAATSFTVGQNLRPSGNGGSGDMAITGATATLANGGLIAGSVLYTISDLDLTAEGGTANETVTFTVSYTATGGTAAANGFGNIFVTGGTANQINDSQTLSVTVSLTSSTFANLTLDGFTEAGNAAFGSGETANLTHSGGVLMLAGDETFATSEPISGNSFTYAPTSGTSNIQSFDVQFTAAPAREIAVTAFSFDPVTGDASLTWDSREGATVSYSIFGSGDLSQPIGNRSEVSDSVSTDGDSTTYMFNDPDLVGKTRYFYVVREN